VSVICVDLSHYQAGFNFAQFKAGGGLGVILKATEGATYKDTSYKAFRSQALAAGLKVASYHFFRPGDPASQASFYLSAADPDQGERVVCDWEDTGCSADDVVAFLQAIQGQRPDLELTVYSGNVAKEQCPAKNDWLAANTSLWLAQYASTCSWPSATWPTWSLWQYSDSGAVPGFNGDVDCNRFNGSNANFLAWIGPAAPAPPPAAIAAVDVTVRADQPINLTVNGVPVALSAREPERERTRGRSRTPAE
jgi:lysozyme